MKNAIKYIVFLSAIALLLAGCGKTTIVGKWAQGSFVYTFNEDGTCSYDISGNTMECTYEAKDGNISILYNGTTSPFKTKYSIDGKTLHIEDSFGSDVTYEKQ